MMFSVNKTCYPRLHFSYNIAISDQTLVGNNEPQKRQRRWNTENLKIPEPQSSTLTPITPKDNFLSGAPKRNFSRSDSTVSEDAKKNVLVIPPSPKPPTNSLRIDRFLPFTLKSVQELLGKTGNVASFWMDHIKTHCYVTYSSVEEAINTRNAVYNLQWPPNGGRLLVAEFVDPQEVKTRQPSLVNISRSNSSFLLHLLSPPRHPCLTLPKQRAASSTTSSPLTLTEKHDPPIVTLDDLFRKTKATPRIYYLPLAEEQVEAKLATQGKNKSRSR
ncbi:hypothetical protein FNV43_RR18451 [Rhamnella rubrinervis]|uniref:Uncharacterized protein n=1 Tax=Rhamnella rubrinervis TaxID=2594499 RepID=A0A8K0GSY2_9ROSA|nr:hypothetical protein FNV43_RR18451 [Rhamnella rubrinervis]